MYFRVVIGLFGLLGIFGVGLAPLIGRSIDRLVPWYATLFAIVMGLLAQCVQTGAGGINIAAVIITTIGLDVFRQVIQVSLSAAIFE